MQKILYFSPVQATFVTKDIELLSEQYEVKLLVDSWNRSIRTLFSAFYQLFFLIKHGRRVEAIFVMFAGYWSFLPGIYGKLFGIPVYLILGGTDSVSFPFLNYGSLRKPVLARFIKWSCQLATKLLPVHESLIHYHYSYHPEATFDQQGIKAFFPDIRTPSQAIYNGFDPSFFTPGLGQKIENSFVTVASIDSSMRFKLKGIDLIFAIAERLPDCHFKIIGFAPEMLIGLAVPSNVEPLPILDKQEFRQILNESQFFIQPSVSEGFPNSFGEAMLCNCIPIGSAVGAIPLLIGETGIILSTNSLDDAVSKIKVVQDLPNSDKDQLAESARERIIKNFTLARRQEEIIALIRSKGKG